MDKLAFRTINKTCEIRSFLEKVEYFSNVRLPYSYAKRCKIIGVFLQEKIVAGYMVIDTPKFRSLNFIPDTIKANTDLAGIDEYEMMEINGLWISPAVKAPRLQFRIWMELLKDVFTSRKKYLLLLSNVKNKNIQYIHGLTNPTTIYEGSPHLYSGDNSHNQIRVSYTTRWSAVSNLPKYWLELRNRTHRASKHVKNSGRGLAQTPCVST